MDLNFFVNLQLKYQAFVLIRFCLKKLLHNNNCVNEGNVNFVAGIMVIIVIIQIVDSDSITGRLFFYRIPITRI